MSRAAANPPESRILFSELGLPEPLLKALSDVGYEGASPIQAAAVPALLGGRDVLGQAQTGTGKTAAFALPILARVAVGERRPQALVLTPTRELAIQVAEAFQRYARHIAGFQVLPVYGGQSHAPQLAALRRGVQVVVGTPGRILDHLERRSLDLSALGTLVLDEADEMLRMGFIDDVETVITKCPPQRQVALFSATMPEAIRRIARQHLRDPAEVTIRSATSTLAATRQRYWWVAGVHKLDALTRILEAEPFEAMVVFARTRQATEELAERLAARGFTAAAIHGEIQQAQRERTIQRLKSGAIDILVATDVAARGLDVERISHVLNYDMPYDTESYVHRIGRTGRAGRSGEAILFVTPREKGMLRAIERATRQPIAEMQLPSVDAVNDQRVAKFLARIDMTLAEVDLSPYRRILEQHLEARDVPALDVAAALAHQLQGDAPLLLEAPRQRADAARPSGPRREDASTGPGPADAMRRYRVEVGHTHGVRAGNIVGAIANEAGLPSQRIGRVDIRDDHSLVELPEDLPGPVLEHLQKVWVAGRTLRIRPAGSTEPERGTRRRERPSGVRAASRPRGDAPRRS